MEYRVLREGKRTPARIPFPMVFHNAYLANLYYNCHSNYHLYTFLPNTFLKLYIAVPVNPKAGNNKMYVHSPGSR